MISSFGTCRQGPLEIASETYVIRDAMPSLGGSFTNQNAMLINGVEPVIVDTGLSANRQYWFEDLFSIVQPEAVRWIFITHNDCDHDGNLVATLERCPNATLITSRNEAFRMTSSHGIRIDRMRLVNPGDTFGVGDRLLRSIRPPVYDSPYTCGLFDQTTGVYYASDAFCAPMPEGPVDWVEEIDERAWQEGFSRFHHLALCPWVALADQQRFSREVMKLAELDIRVIAGSHTPAIRGRQVQRAFELLAQLPSFSP